VRRSNISSQIDANADLAETLSIYNRLVTKAIELSDANEMDWEVLDLIVSGVGWESLPGGRSCEPLETIGVVRSRPERTGRLWVISVHRRVQLGAIVGDWVIEKDETGLDSGGVLVDVSDCCDLSQGRTGTGSSEDETFGVCVDECKAFGADEPLPDIVYIVVCVRVGLFWGQRVFEKDRGDASFGEMAEMME
jgi:hypothetical protein